MMSPGNILTITLKLKHHLILVLKTRAVQISSQMKFASSCLLLNLGSPLQAYTRSCTHLCCQQNILAGFVSAFRRNKAQDNNGKMVSRYTSIELQCTLQSDMQSKQTHCTSIEPRLHGAAHAAVGYSTRSILYFSNFANGSER